LERKRRRQRNEGQSLIYICIPTHNEQQTVGVVLWKLRQVLTEYPRDYQLLVADDASTDKTQEVLEPYTRVLPLTVIRSEQRQGYAASLEMLLREAARRSEYPKRDVIVTLQADFSEEPDDLVALIRRMEAGADVAVGTKVSASKPTRVRRWARALSNFFARRQQWPEGVVTPFDGFRAYRLYAVKRAIEEREGRRLLRYDGWAGHAELLRAVLPHARRVDVVDVDDRADRLQRPSRERPFASALQVRAMMSDAEPDGLIGVEALDQVAATAARSRERTLVVNGRGNGRERQPSRERRPARERPEGRSRTREGGRGGSRNEGDSSRPARTGGRSGESAQRDQGRQGEGTAEARPPRGRRTGRQGEERAGRSQPAAGAAAPGAATAENPLLPPDDALPANASEAGVDGAPRPKRKRRRRGRGGSGATGEAGVPAGDVQGGEQGADHGGEQGVPAEPAGPDEGAADAGLDPETGEPRRRRRRGGRRGGRGRRRAGAGAEAGAEGAEGTAGAEGAAGADGTPAGEGGSSTSAGGADASPAAQPAPAAEARRDPDQGT
jgi:glycosyltransferase involved in cell wall biosynthesis